MVLRGGCCRDWPISRSSTRPIRPAGEAPTAMSLVQRRAVADQIGEVQRNPLAAARGSGWGFCPLLQLKPDHAAVRSWLHMVRVLSAELPNMAGMLTNELVKAQVASAVLTGFLLAITPDERATAARPRIVKRVVDRLHEDPARAWTVADMAEIAGVSVRRLQEGFQEYLGTSPMAYLRDVRLTRIHEELSRHQRNSTIAEIAARWGFPHTG